MNVSRTSALTAALVVLALGSSAVGQSPAPVFTVRLTAPVDHAVKGRLLILAEPVPRAGVVDHVRVDPSPASGSAVAARDVTLAPGQSIDVDGDLVAFPAFSHLKPGAYMVQAALDVHNVAAYDDQVLPGDVTGPVTQVTLPATRVSLILDKVAQETPSSWDRTDAAVQPAKAHTERLTLPSKLLTDFWKAPTGIRAYVLTPPGYDRDRPGRYPVVFETEGFGATFDGNFARVTRAYADMASGAEPPMIWVFIDHAGPTGTNEFADSANNGPWGAALTTEFIPWLDSHYHTDGDAKGRFTTGHSSGGWASLWLQVAYPKMFGGAWPTSPDPVDFHDFTNIDLYAAHPNAYHLPGGQPTPLVRSQAPATFEQFARWERALGPVGGQISSFDWVFSPRGADGKPVPLFNEKTGEVDTKVAAYWVAHYDITAMIKRDWPRLKPDLDGKIHLWVGTQDTYYLDGPAYMLKVALDQLGAQSEFHFIEGANHGSVMTENGDPRGVERTIAWEMYAVARPGTKRPPKTP